MITKRDIAFAGVIIGFAMMVVGIMISEKGRIASDIPGHSTVYEQNGQYYYRHGNPAIYPPVEVTKEQYDLYVTAESKSRTPSSLGLLLAMSSGIFIIFSSWFSLSGRTTTEQSINS